MNIFKKVNNRKKPLLSKLFRHKKVVVISDDDIVTMPLGPKAQAFISMCFIFSMVWLSYSSGKYFAYQDLISLKDKEIMDTNLTNENLQYQVTDLHRNFARLDKYFSQIQKIRDNANTGKKNSKSKNNAGNESVDKEANDKISALEDDIKDMLLGLHGQINTRISTLESAINKSGIGIKSILNKNADLRKAAARSSANASRLSDESTASQGGPYIPADSVYDITESDVFERSLESNVDYLLELEKIIQNMPYSKPMLNSRISSRYGYRTDPINKKRAMHNGIDFVGSYRSPIVASAPGKVTRAGRNGAYGKYIEIDHGNGITTRYGHLSKIKVSKNTIVKRGTVIGLQGNTGRSTGAHLHYEIRYNNKPLDPYKFIKAGKYVL